MLFLYTTEHTSAWTAQYKQYKHFEYTDTNKRKKKNLCFM